MNYTISINVDVHDEGELWEAARQRAIEDGLGEEEHSDVIGTKELPDISGCLIMIFDPGLSPPGCSINESTVE